MENINKIKKLLEIVDGKYLSKMFDKPVEYEIGQINVFKNKHYIIDVIIPNYYFDNEPYESKMDEWWDKLLKVREYYSHMTEDGSVNFQPILKK